MWRLKRRTLAIPGVGRRDMANVVVLDDKRKAREKKREKTKQTFSRS